MAIVPLAENRVQEQGLPNIRSSANVPLDALGGGQSAEQVTNSQLALNDSIQKEIFAQKQKADQMVHVEVQGKLANLESEMLYGKNGQMTKNGKDAMYSVESTLDSYKKRAEEIIGGLATDSQRRSAFMQTTQNFDQVQKQIMRHSAVEAEKVFDEEHQSAVTNMANVAIMSNNPEVIENTNGEIKNILNEYADKKGFPGNMEIDEATGTISVTGEARVLLLRQAQSKLYAGVVENRIKLGQYESANRYYDNKLKFILPPDREGLSGGLKEGKLRQETQDLSDKIFREHPLDKPQQIVDDLTVGKPELRDRLNADLDYRYRMDEAQVKKQVDDTFLENVKTSLANPGVPPEKSSFSAEYARMSDSDKELCALALNPPLKDNEKAQAEIDESLKDGKLGLMEKADFERIALRMSLSQRQKAQATWELAVQDITSPQKSPELASTINFNDRVEDTFRKANDLSDGLPSSKFGVGFGDFKKEAAREIEMLAFTQKEKPTGTQMQEIIDRLAIKGIVEKRPWFFGGNKTKLAFEADPSKSFEVNIQDIPKKEAQRIKILLEQAGQPTDDDTIRKTYGDALVRSKQ